MGIKPYPQYRPSMVDYLRDIPQHWGTMRLKYAALFAYGDSLASDSRDIDGEIPVYGSNGIIGYHSVANTSKPCLIIGRKGSSGKINYSDAPCFAIDTTFYIDEYTSDVNLRWLYYALQPLNLDSYSQDAAVPGLSREFAYSQWLPEISMDEQQAIADFLDRETAVIDTLIAKKQKLIQRLQEKRTALISHVVTKGLDPSASMKDSAVEWIGAIPNHWENVKIKFIARLESGHTPSRQVAEYWIDCTIPWFSLADVWQIRGGHKIYVQETKEKISELGLANSSARILPAGTVILSRTASVGYSAIMQQAMATTQDFANWVCGELILPEYLVFVFRAMQPEFKRLTMGSTHQTIYMPDIAQFVTPLPSLEEQMRIADYVQEVSTFYFSLIDKLEQATEMLYEYRTSLISSAVTGKIDVRSYGQEDV